MKILALESSAKAASVAIVDDEKLLGQFFQNTGLTHSRTMLQMAEDLLKNLFMLMTLPSDWILTMRSMPSTVVQSVFV